MDEPAVITDDQVERALDYLRENADVAAEATAQRRHLEEFRKAKLAMIASEADGSEAAKEREALASEEYAEFLEGLKEAIRLDEYHRHLRKRAELTIDAWRTQTATTRAMKL